MILMDTDACSLLIRGGAKRLDAKIRQLPPRDVCISAVTRAELLYGLARKPEATVLHELVRAFLTRVRSLAWSNEAAAHYADLRAFLERTGQPLENMDLMIAAHARSIDAPLVTGNAGHFERVPGLSVLDWGR
jgi:tRNA(fMet)-specific endonuclease VapC